MARPSHTSVVNAIYATVSQPTLWPSTLEVLCDHVGAAGGMMAYQNFVGAGGFLKTARLRDDLTELYLRDHASNPYARGMARVAPGKVVQASEIADEESVRRSAFHADILAPQKIEGHILVGHAALTSRTTSGGFSLTLDARQTEDQAAVAKRFSRLAPHLSRALDLSLELGREDARRGLAAVLDALPGAALLIDRACRVRQANGRANRLLARRDGLWIDGDGHLATAGSQNGRDLASVLKAAVTLASGQEVGDARSAIKIVRQATGAPFFVVVTPLPPAAFATWEALDTGARALVQIVDPDEDLDRQAQVLRAAVGLTATETRVAALVAAGRTTPEVAALLRLSPSTVRTHLARCFDKSGSHSQVALARLLASLSG